MSTTGRYVLAWLKDETSVLANKRQHRSVLPIATDALLLSQLKSLATITRENGEQVVTHTMLYRDNNSRWTSESNVRYDWASSIGTVSVEPIGSLVRKMYEDSLLA